MIRQAGADQRRFVCVAWAAVLIGVGPQLPAAEVTLAWDPNREPDLAGYRLYCGTRAGVYDHVVDVGNVTTSTLTGLEARATYWFVATAYNAAGLESDPSNEVTYTVPNQPPSIGPVADQTVPEDAVMGPLAIAVHDADNDPGTLTLTASSSNPALLPQNRLVLGGSGAERTVRATPAANAFGSTLITLRVSDGEAAATQSFRLTVTPVNDPPTMTVVPNQTTAEDHVMGPVPFQVRDVDNDAGSLTVTSQSSNPALLPQANVVLGGSGMYRTVTAKPVAHAHGATIITLAVSDRQATLKRTFTLTVNPVNDPPTISSIADQVTPKDVPVGPIHFEVGDVDDDPGTLTLTASSSNPDLVPDANLALAGSEADRTITVTPAACQVGTTTITLTVSDGAAESSTEFALVVEDNLPSPWTAHDIGAPTFEGCTSFQESVFTVTAAGTDIAGTTDQFHFARQPLSGDGEIIARVASLDAQESGAKAGVMIRETLDGNSRNAFLGLTPGDGFRFQQRSFTGSSTVAISGGPLYAPPNNWVRLVREGNRVTAYTSGDGLAWRQIKPILTLSISMASEIHLGLAVTAGSESPPCIATFDHLTVLP